MIGRTISHYKIIEKLGSGGMGVVYKAQDTRLDRVVALKFLTPFLSQDEGVKNRFIHEAKAASSLSHANIATIYEINEAEGQLFIAMEYIVGRPLNELVGASDRDGMPLPIDAAVDYAIQIAEGLQAAHEKGIVHRDIKPANIIISEKGQAKILDFGLAKLAGRSMLTREGTTLGTIAYMSPEQAKGSVVDHRSDVWALGAVLYEMITGQPPFTGDYEQAVIYSILNEDPGSITAFRSDLPKGLRSIMNKALAKNPEKRYQRIDELEADLRDLQESQKLGAEDKRSSPEQRRHSSRRLFVIAASAVLILLAIILGWLRFSSAPSDMATPPSRSAIAVLPFSVHGASEFDYLAEGMVNLLSTKLDGAGDLRSVDPRALLSFVTREMSGALSPDDGRKVAQQFGAGFFVMGDIVEAGGRLQINAALYDWDPGTKVVAESTVEGEAEQIFSIMDELATKLLTSLTGESGTRVTRLAAVTTSQLPAIKAYLEGESALRKADFESATEAFQRAVSIDTLFALAYYRLSVAAEWLLRSGLAHDAAQLAFRHAGRLSARDRRLLEGLLAYRQGKSGKAEELYRSLLGTHPDDVEAWIQLGEVLFHYNPLHGRSFAEAREPFERVLFYEPQHTASLVHLARIAAAEGKYSELDSLVQIYVSLYPSGGRVLPLLALRTFALGSPDEQDRFVARLEKARDEDVALAVWNVALYVKNLQAAERLMRVLAESTRFSSEVQSVARAWLAHLMLGKGQWRRAQQELSILEQLDALTAQEYRAILACLPFVSVEAEVLTTLREDLSRVPSQDILGAKNPSAFFSDNTVLHPLIRVYLEGILSSRLGDNSRAVQNAEQLQQLSVPRGAGSLASDLALSIEAHIDLHDGRKEAALAKLERTRRQTWYELMLSSPFYSQAYERFMVAELLFELGREREALGWYSNLATTSAFEVMYVAISHLRRAEIYERLGQVERAVQHYSRFIELWRDCDPEFRPLWEKARQKLSNLRGVAGQR